MKSDIDPLYYCEVRKLCPIKDDGDAKFIYFGVTPKKAAQNTEFVIDCSFVSINGTGTGSFTTDIVNPKNESFDTDFLF
ncbi:unnamed protein product [Rotaria sp. Silwood2]|nr:unnamed protein product [Rotaria sp. Silwood2]